MDNTGYFDKMDNKISINLSYHDHILKFQKYVDNVYIFHEEKKKGRYHEKDFEKFQIVSKDTMNKILNLYDKSPYTYRFIKI